MTSKCPFHWQENPRPSIFARDPRFTPTVLGITHSEVSSVSATRNIDRTTKRTGINPGTITGISEKADARMRQI